MIARRIETMAIRLGLFFAGAMAIPDEVIASRLPTRPTAVVDTIDEVRWLIEAARAVCEGVGRHVAHLPLSCQTVSRAMAR